MAATDIIPRFLSWCPLSATDTTVEEWVRELALYPDQSLIVVRDDIFGPSADVETIDKAFAAMALNPQHIFLVRTQHAEYMQRYCSAPGAQHRIYTIVCDVTVESALNVVLVAAPEHAEAAPAGRHVKLYDWPLSNVWLGVTVQNQRDADRNITRLLDTPAADRYIGADPLRARVDLTHIAGRFSGDGWVYIDDALTGFRAHKCGGWTGTKLDWVIVGGGQEPIHPDWLRSLRDQCAAAGVPFYFTQWGDWWEVDSDARGEDGKHLLLDEATLSEGFEKRVDCLISPDGRVFRDWQDSPEGVRCRWMTRLGRKAAGRILDGVEHLALPQFRKLEAADGQA